MTIQLKTKEGKQYMIITKDEPILDNLSQHKDLWLACTFACETFLEFRVKTLEEWEKEASVEEVLASVPYIKYF